jgi:hypothetical protein
VYERLRARSVAQCRYAGNRRNWNPHFDGVLNCEYQDVDGEMVETDPADVGPRPWEDNARWRHAVALIDGVVHEQHEQRLPMAVLHLESPFKEGYFLSVLKIYRVVRCRAGDSASCRGECVGPLA